MIIEFVSCSWLTIADINIITNTFYTQKRLLVYEFEPYTSISTILIHCAPINSCESV